MILASWLISGNALTYLSFSILDVPYPLEFLDLEYGFGQDVRGFVAYTTNNLPVLTFTATFFLIQVFLLGKRSLVHLATLAITLPAIALSLRLAFILNICLSAVIIVVMAYVGPLQIRRKEYGLAFVLALVALGSLAITQVDTDLADGIFDLKLDRIVHGQDLRYAQATVWLDHVMDRPWLGNGLTSVDVQMFSRNGELTFDRPGPIVNPYGYELTYLKLLVEIGILPLLFCAFLVGLLSLGLWRAVWRGETRCDREAFAYLVGMLLFLLASSSNGYLLSFGFMWTIYFPVAFLNHTWAFQKQSHPPANGRGGHAADRRAKDSLSLRAAMGTCR